MNTTIKTPENLTWKSLMERYPITTVKVDGKNIEVNALKDAIEDGTLIAEVEEAAAGQGIETYDMLSRMARTLSSNLTNAKKRYDSPSKRATIARCELLRMFVKENMNKLNAAKTDGKAMWRYTIEDIEAIPLDDIKKLTSVRDCMASELSKYPEKLHEGFHEAYAFARKRLSEANKLAKQAASTAVLDDSTLALVAKLKAGKNLSKDDKAALATVLEGLSK